MAESLWNLGGLTWSELGKRVYNEIWKDDVLGSAAQLAYYFLFALFPLLIFLTSILGILVGTNNELRNNLFLYLGSILPSSALGLVSSVITEVSQASSGGKITLGLLLALWAASSGVEAITQTINRAYGIKESRPWWKLRLLAIGLTIALALLIVSALIIVLFGEHIIDWIAASYGFGDAFRTVWKVAQWFIVLLFVFLAFALIYYWSPDVREQKWYWITPGSFAGVALWLLVSFAFRVYLNYFDSYSATYGSLGAVIILMLWLYFLGVSILIGAEFNSEIENAAAESGNPSAKKSGEKAPHETENKQPEMEAQSKKKEEKPVPQTGALARESKKAGADTETPSAAEITANHPPRNIVSRLATVGYIVGAFFASFRKNENNK
jgi:membrane protein